MNKAELVGGTEHARLTWGAAQAGVAVGVTRTVAQGTIPAELVTPLLLIVALWVDQGASDESAVYTNNREATRRARESGASGRPTAAEVMAAVDGPANPFLRIGIDQLASFEH